MYNYTFKIYNYVLVDNLFGAIRMKLLKKSLASFACVSFAALIIGCGGKSSNAAEANGTAPLQVAQTQANTISETQTLDAGSKTENLKMADADFAGKKEIDSSLLKSVKAACDHSDAAGFINQLGYSRELAAKYFAKEISISEYTMGSNAEPMVRKVKAANYIFPISLLDFMWVKTGSYERGNTKYLAIEINQSSNNQIALEYQELPKAPSEDGDGDTSARSTIDFDLPHSTILFQPKGNCWELTDVEVHK